MAPITSDVHVHDTCRLCQREYPRDQWVLDTARHHIIVEFDIECCRSCRRAFWHGVAATAGIWFAVGMIWWGLRIVDVVE